MPVVLFTCAGQRVDIVTAFGRAGATTLAVDANELAPALYAADRRALVPRGRRSRATSTRCGELVELHDVRLIVPLADLDHRAARRAPRRPRRALVLLPGPGGDPRSARTSSRRTASSSEQGIASPPTWVGRRAAGRAAAIPVLVKARRGFGSRHIYRAADRGGARVLPRATRRSPSMVQQVCVGEEFSIDVFCDLDGPLPRTRSRGR